MPVWDQINSQSGKGSMGGVYPDSVCSFAAPQEGEHQVAKPTFDGFLQTNLESLLQQLEITEVYVAGMVTSCCVLFTAVRAPALAVQYSLEFLLIYFAEWCIS